MAIIIDELKGSADYHSGGLYGLTGGADQKKGKAALLTFCRNLRIQPDAGSYEYVPIDTVSSRGRAPLPFIVGILPPNQYVSGRALDRSASTGGPIPDPPITFKETAVSYPEPFSPVQDLPPSFWLSWVRMCESINQDPINLAAVINTESGFNPSRENIQTVNGQKVAYAKGLNQFVKSSAMGGNVQMSEPEWENYSNLSAEDQLVYVARYFSSGQIRKNSSKASLYRANFGGYNNPDGSIYASAAQQAAWKKLHPEAVFLQPSRQDDAINRNSGLVAKHSVTGEKVITMAQLAEKMANQPAGGIANKIRQAQQSLSTELTQPSPVAADAQTSADWAGTASKDAQEASAQEAKLASTKIQDLQSFNRDSQKAQSAQIKKALEAMASAPPLKMLINPSSMSTKFQKQVTDGSWSREGPIVEYQGNDQDKISGSGTVAGFYTLLANPNLNEGGPGLSRTTRNYSASWQNFMALYLMYRSNGGLFLDDVIQGGQDTLLSTVGSVYIYYDNTMYIGSFNSFTISEDSSKFATVTYSFEFTVRAAFLLDQPSDWGQDGKAYVDASRASAHVRSSAVSPPATQDTTGSALALLNKFGL
jgi:hypothetical protein